MEEAKLLISFADMTPLRGFEKLQELYFVFLGYDPTGNASQEDCNIAEKHNPLLARYTPDNEELKKWLYLGASPIIQMRKKNRHVFPGGFPIYYAVPGDLVSFYVAIMESDRSARDHGDILKKAFDEDLNKNLIEQVLDHAGAESYTNAFTLAIKALEVALLNNRDNMRYSNVWTFRAAEGYLAGQHTGWGNQRVAFTVDVDY